MFTFDFVIGSNYFIRLLLLICIDIDRDKIILNSYRLNSALKSKFLLVERKKKFRKKKSNFKKDGGFAQRGEIRSDIFSNNSSFFNKVK